MKGDLGTLRKVCRYASKVMLAGEFVLVAFIVVTVTMGLGSLVSEAVSEALDSLSWIIGEYSGTRFVEVVFILVLGTLTVDAVRRLMDTFQGSHTPFTDGNADLMKRVSVCYLVSSFILLALEIASGSTVSGALFIFLGTLLVCVVLYCLSIVFRYGTVLQVESDHTL